MIDCGASRLYWLASAAPAARKAAAAADNRKPLLIMRPPPVFSFALFYPRRRTSPAAQVAPDLAPQRVALLAVQIPPDLDLTAVRAQREPPAVAARHLRPAAVQLVATPPSRLADFDFHPVAGDRDALEIARAPVNVAERQPQNQHLQTRERQDQPRPEQRETRGDADRTCEDEGKDEQPAGGAERIVASGDPRKSGRTGQLAALQSCGHFLPA